MQDKGIGKLTSFLKEKLSSKWGTTFIAVTIFLISPYLPPVLKLALWALFLISLIVPIVNGFLREMKNQD